MYKELAKSSRVQRLGSSARCSEFCGKVASLCLTDRHPTKSKSVRRPPTKVSEVMNLLRSVVMSVGSVGLLLPLDTKYRVHQHARYDRTTCRASKRSADIDKRQGDKRQSSETLPLDRLSRPPVSTPDGDSDSVGNHVGHNE